MTEYKEHNEIRNLITRWYEGGTTPAEERRLAEFFATAGTLPADLENERAMFRAIGAVDEQEVEIPEELARRIDNALEEEMARERNTSSVSSRFRRWMIAAGAVAASLAAALMVSTYVITDDEPARHQTHLALDSPSVPIATAPDTAPDTAVVMASDEINPVGTMPSGVQDDAKRRIASSAHKTRIDRPRHVEANSAEEEADENVYLSEAEEQKLIAANYRVVRDEREADAILSTVFVRLEGSVVEESYRISDINAEYEMEMAKLYN